MFQLFSSGIDGGALAFHKPQLAVLRCNEPSAGPDIDLFKHDFVTCFKLPSSEVVAAGSVEDFAP